MNHLAELSWPVARYAAFALALATSCSEAADDDLAGAAVATNANESTSAQETLETSATTTANVDPAKYCAGFTSEAQCDPQHCSWFDLRRYADTIHCPDSASPTDARCMAPAPADPPYPTTYVDPAGIFFYTSGRYVCDGPQLRPAGWRQCTLTADAAPGCTCTSISGISAGGRAAMQLHECSFPAIFTMEVPGDMESTECTDDEQAGGMIAALAAGKLIHATVREIGYLYSVTRHIFGRAGGQVVLHQRSVGDVLVCGDGWAAPQLCQLRDAVYFQGLMDRGASCRDAQALVDSPIGSPWLSECEAVVGPIACPG